MSILLTGATGYIGSSVLPRLLEEGHTVTALVRDDAKAEAVSAAGATAVVGDATDAALVTRLAAESDGVIHLASASDVDPGFVAAVLEGLGEGPRTVQALVERIYPDRRVHHVAAQQVLGHLQKLEREGRVAPDGERWTLRA